MGANFNFNKVILGGRLTAEPELKVTPNGIAVTSFTVAVNRPYVKDKQTQADFINVTAWRGTAEFVCKYFRKASSICVVGSLQTRSWVDRDGQKRFATEIVADEAYFVDSKADMPGNNAGAGQTLPGFTPPPALTELAGDEELPF